MIIRVFFIGVNYILDHIGRFNLMEPPPPPRGEPVVIKIKRKYVRNNTEKKPEIPVPAPLPGSEIVKPKRKYTRKIRVVEPAIDPSAVVVTQPKRKYTRKNPPISAPPSNPDQAAAATEPIAVMPPAVPKPKRKYTRKLRPAPPVAANKEGVSKTDIKTSSPIISIPSSAPPPMSARSTSPKNMKPAMVQLLKDLAYIMRTRKEFMRAKAYDNARETVETFPGPITDPQQLVGKPGIGKTILEKFAEFAATGSLKILDEEKEALRKKRAMDVFSEIYGVGEKKAAELVDKGITTLAQLEAQQAQVLNDKQRIGLKYYRDILERIPRSEIEDYERAFLTSAAPLRNLRLQIVGSYRRQMPDSGDIDVILTSENPQDFVAFVDALLKENIIVEVLSRGSSKCLVIGKLPWANHVRRVDFLYTSPKEYPFAVLYFTGSKGFNTVMRERALAQGLTMNEHGFSKMEGRKKGEPVTDTFTTEKDIFDYLGVEYKEPQERVDGKAVVLRSATPPENVAENVPEKMAEPPKKKRLTKKKQVIENKVGEPAAKSPPKNPENEVKSAEKPAQVLLPKKIRVTKKSSPLADETHQQVCRVVSKTATEHIREFNQEGIKVLESLSETQLAAMLDAANNAFHCVGEPVMTDGEYDILHEYVEKKFPKNAVLQEVGATVEKNKAKLPYEMWSMDKIKPDSGTLDKWKQKYPGPYVISCKLDGVSGLYTTEGAEPKLYTRGDGKVGQDVSYLIPYLKLPKERGLVIRGEFIISRTVFDTKYREKFANPRNLVAGIANAKTVDDKIRDVDFVAYEVIKPENLTPSQQMAKLASFSGLFTANLVVVQNKTEAAITNETLSETLQDWRKSSVYEIDGIIVSDDRVYPRMSGNPDHSFAFKMVLSDQVAETHVVDVIWTASKDGYLKPRVQVMPVRVGGVTIQYATGFNAEFIEKNKIGVGAVIQIIRSGDVIPYIQSVTTPAAAPKMPTEAYRWNDTHVDIILKDVSQNVTVLEKQIAAFFKGIEVDGLGPGNVKKIIKAGYTSVPNILRMSEADLLKVEGFQQKTAKKLFDGIHAKIDAASLTTLMTASQQFGRGFGPEVVELIMTKYPEVLREDERNVAKLVAIPGIGQKTAERFVEHIPQFMTFIKECGLEDKIRQKIASASTSPAVKAVPATNTVISSVMSMFTGTANAVAPTDAKPTAPDSNDPLYGKSIAMTGFRDKELEAVLKTRGAKVSPNIKNGLLALLVKTVDENQTSGKLKEAKEKNVPIMTLAEFKQQYNL